MTLALITKGFRYGGRILDLDATTLATAIADGWATDLTGDPYPFVTDGVDRYAAEPESLKIWYETSDGTYVPPTPPAPVPIVSISKADPAVVTVAAGDIGKFTSGDTVTIAGVTGTGWTVCNGSQEIGTKSGNTFPLTDVDTTAATGETPTATGTVTPPAE